MVLDAEVAEAVRVDVHALAGVRKVVLVVGTAIVITLNLKSTIMN